jgi:hypothetical protein
LYRIRDERVQEDYERKAPIYLSIYLPIYLLYIHPSTSTVTKSTNFRAGRNGVVELIAARPVCALDLSHLSHLLRRVTNHTLTFT